MNLIDNAQLIIVDLAQKFPIEIFSLVGALVEEVMAPIPSPLIGLVIGSVARTKNLGWVWVFWLAMLFAVGKTIGAVIIYYASDRLEDLFSNRFSKIIGISHQEIEDAGQSFGGGIKDAVIIFICRAIPVVPSTPISAISGIIKIDIKHYVIATWLGSWVRALIYIYIGHLGIEVYKNVLLGFDSIENSIQMIILGIIIGVVGWAYRIKKNKRGGISYFKKQLKKVVKAINNE